jgi:hypothetical protein
MGFVSQLLHRTKKFVNIRYLYTHSRSYSVARPSVCEELKSVQCTESEIECLQTELLLHVPTLFNIHELYILPEVFLCVSSDR